jgi:hypothetical protein
MLRASLFHLRLPSENVFSTVFSTENPTDIPVEKSIKGVPFSLRGNIEAIDRKRRGSEKMNKCKKKKKKKMPRVKSGSTNCVCGAFSLYFSYYSSQRLALNVKHGLTSEQPPLFSLFYPAASDSIRNTAFHQHPERNGSVIKLSVQRTKHKNEKNCCMCARIFLSFHQSEDCARGM